MLDLFRVTIEKSISFLDVSFQEIKLTENNCESGGSYISMVIFVTFGKKKLLNVNLRKSFHPGAQSYMSTLTPPSKNYRSSRQYISPLVL